MHPHNPYFLAAKKPNEIEETIGNTSDEWPYSIIELEGDSTIHQYVLLVSNVCESVETERLQHELR